MEIGKSASALRMRTSSSDLAAPAVPSRTGADAPRQGTPSSDGFEAPKNAPANGAAANPAEPAAGPGSSPEAIRRRLLANPTLAKYLGDKDVKRALDALQPSFGELGNNPIQTALSALRDAASNVPPEVIEQAVIEVAKGLESEGMPGVARDLLTDPAVVRELITNGKLGEAFESLARGDLSGLSELAKSPALQQKLGDALAKSPALQKALGLSADELKAAGGKVVELAQCAAKLWNLEEPGEQLGKLLELSRDPKLRALVQKSIGALSDSIAGGLQLGTPRGFNLTKDPLGLFDLVSKALKNTDLLTALAEDKGLQQALTQLVNGDLGGALKTVAGNERAQKALLDTLAGHPEIKKALASAGLKPEDVKDLGQALKAAPQLADAIAKMAKGDYRGALEGLREAMKNPAVADFAKKTLGGVAERWAKDVVQWAEQKLPKDSPIRALLGNPELVSQIVSDPKLHDAIGLIGEGKFGEALQLLGKTEAGQAVARKAADALLQNPQIAEGLKKLGLTPERLEKARPAIPHLLRATEALAAGKGGEAVDHLLAAGQAAPDLVADAVAGIAKNWGELKGMPAALQSLLQDKALVKDIAGSPALRGAVKSLMEGNLSGDDVRKLLADEKIGQRVIDGLAKTEAVQGALKALGLTPADLQQLRAAAPDLLQAASHFANQRYGDMLKSLAAAGQHAPDLVAKVFKDKLPNVPLLHDKAFLEKLAKSPVMGQVVDHVARGELSQAFQALGQDKGLRDAFIDAVFAGGWGGVLKDRLGLTADDLKKSADAVPHLLYAAKSAWKGDWQGAVANLVGAAKASPELVKKALGAIADKARLPPVVKALVTNPALLDKLLKDEKLQRAFSDLIPAGDSRLQLTPFGMRTQVEGALKTLLAQAPELAKDVAGALADDPKVKGFLDKLGLSKEDLVQCAGALPAVVAAGQALLQEPPDFKAALDHFREAVGEMPPKLLARAAGKLAQLVPGLPSWVKSALSNEGLIANLAGSKDMQSAVKSLLNGDARGAMETLAKSDEVLGIALDSMFADPKLGPRLRDLGLTKEKLIAAKKALPHLLEAAEKLAADPQKNWQEALGHLVAAAGEGGKDLVRDAINGAAKKVFKEGSLPASILGDPAFVGSLLDNPDYLKHFQNGDVTAGLRALMNNKEARDVVLKALGNSAPMKRAMERFGLTPEDVRTMGLAAVNVFEAGEALAQNPPDFKLAMSRITGMYGALKAQGVKDEEIARLAGKMVQGLPIPQKLKEVVGQVAKYPGAVDELSQALTAVAAGKGDEFVAHLARAGKALPNEAKVHFLNALGKLPKPVGPLFKSPSLNQAIVQTGTFDRFMTVAEKIATGEVDQAVTELGSACKALMNAGDPIGFDIPWWLGGGRVELPFNDGAFSAIADAFSGLIESMPDYVKNELQRRLAAAAVSSAARNIPLVGNIASAISAIGSARDLINSNWDDPLDVLINAGQLGVDVAGIIPGGNNIGSAAGLVLKTAKIVKGVRDLIGKVEQFRAALSGDFMAGLR
ncbi:MAG TPA: hypothetical protein VIG99_32945 [Myxococcaceae bacterium]|jgi:hypothetical protein